MPLNKETNQTPVRNHQLTLVWKAHWKEENNNHNIKLEMCDVMLIIQNNNVCCSITFKIILGTLTNQANNKPNCIRKIKIRY